MKYADQQTMTDASLPSTARELRASARASEAQLGRLQLLQGVAEIVASQRATRDALAAVLVKITRHLGIDSAVVMQVAGGALTVLAGIGEVLPVGASVPCGGVLAEVTRPPMQPVLREHTASRLLISRDASPGHEWLLPLRVGGRCHGVLALLGARGARGAQLPDRDEQLSMAVVSTLLAGLVTPQQPPKSRRSSVHAVATLARLTGREQQVLGLLPSGASNAEIAERLGMAPGTAKIHVERILHKLGVRDRTAAAVLAAESGLRA